MFLHDKSLVVARQPSREFTTFSSDCHPTSDLVHPPPTRNLRDRHKWVDMCACVSVFVCICIHKLMHVKEPTTRHSGTPELLRAAKPYLPPSISTVFRELSVTLSRTGAASRPACGCSLLVRCRPSFSVIVSITMHRRYLTTVSNVWLCRVTSRRNYITRRRENVWSANRTSLPILEKRRGKMLRKLALS